MKKLLVTSNFFISHNVSYTRRTPKYKKNDLLDIVVCKEEITKTEVEKVILIRGYSQSISPIDNNNHEITHDAPKSPNNNTYTHSTPLSFSNPMYRHYHRGMTSQLKTSSPIPQASSNSSLSSEEAHTVKHVSPVKFDLGERHSVSSAPGESLHRKVKPMSSSSSTDSVHERDRIHQSHSTNSMSLSMHGDFDSRPRGPRHSQSNNNMYSATLDTHDRPRHSKSNNNVCASARDFSTPDKGSASVGNTRKYPTELRASSPLLSHSAHNTKHNYNGNNYSNTIGSTSRRHPELSQSVDFTYINQRYSDQLRRTATDTVISQRSTSPAHSDSSVTSSSVPASPGGHLTPDESSLFRRLTAQNAVHMGIRSVQRRIHEQEKTKQEYESEVNVLKQQLQEAQQRLKMAEERLQEHETETQQITSDWQLRLEESEERMRKQQAEKDDQMKNIIQRLIHVEDELRQEQTEMQKAVTQKQKVIEAQERRIQSLDIANNKLVVALNQLKEHYNATARNGTVTSGPIKKKLSTDLGQFKTSSC